MKIFRLDNDYSIVCNWKKTRNGFKHTADLFYGGRDVCSTKVNYLNRTWEAFEYQTVAHKIITLYFKDKDIRRKYVQIIDNQKW
jgi:hypothetical protein